MEISVSAFPSSSVPVISFGAPPTADCSSSDLSLNVSVDPIENEKTDIIHTSSLADMSKLKSTLSHLAAVFVPSVLSSSIPVDSSQMYNKMSPIPLPESLVAEDFPRLVLTDHEVSLMRSINSTVGLLAMESSEIYDAIHEICLIADTIRCGDSTLSLYYDVLKDLIIGVLNILGYEGYTTKKIIEYITLRVVDIMGTNSLLTKNQIAESIRSMTVVHRRQAACRALRRKESLRLKTKRSDNYSSSYSDILPVIPPKLSSSPISSSAPINHSPLAAKIVPISLFNSSTSESPTAESIPSPLADSYISPNVAETVVAVAESIVSPNVAESIVSPTVAESDVSPTVAESVISPTVAESVISPTVAESVISPTVAESVVSPTVAESVISPTVAESVISPTVAESVVSPTVAESVISPTVAESVISPTVAESVVSPTVAESVLSPNVAESVVSPTVAESVISPTVAESVISPTVAESVISPNVAESVISPNVAESVAVC